METTSSSEPQAASGAERIVELLLAIHGAHVVGLESLRSAGKQTALKTADERLTELAALLLPAVAYVMGEDYDQLGEDDEVTAHAVSVTPASARGAAQNARERRCR
jgi:hypothetical protein